ncbi:enoyl-CoA hydratase/isomerase family protein [Sneathiella glossodoripedis]|uniref:enoyl-CoA hydratase/isomerase family protein n=1 Tax=Sneathiella glossodoripedis TaxID=418853 RepID=UPI0004723845|nr:enoyl-CoA hydratase/isomerase family protein [Sneathiella glossodoripedis]
MGYKYVSVSKENRIAVVRFDQGHRMNPLSVDLMEELTDVARSFETDTETNAVILTGNGENFSAGFDLKGASLKQRMEAGILERRVLQAVGPRMCQAWENIEPMTIAAVDGYCIGGGVALAVSLDFRVSASTASYYVPEIKNGMNMSWNSIPRMVNLIGPARTKQLSIIADIIPAEEAHRWGLVEEIAEGDCAFDLAMEYAQKIAARPPIPVRMIKKGASAAANALNQATSFMDIDQFTLTTLTEDYAEGIQAFLEKRDPDFKGK